MAQLKSTNITGNLSVTGNVLASKIIKLGGTEDQILLANGEVITKTALSGQITNNTTYAFEGGTNKFTVTPSDGTAYDVTITPSITNNITGSGTSGYIAKFNGTNTVTNGPAFGSDATKFLNNKGEWAVPPNDNTEYSAGTGLSLSGTTFNHSNSVTAVTTAGLYKIKYDGQGHITGTESLTLPPDYVKIDISGNSGTLEPEQLTALKDNPHKTVLNWGGYYCFAENLSSTSTYYYSANCTFNGTASIDKKVITLTVSSGAWRYDSYKYENIDTKVTQTITTSSNTSKRPLLLGYSYSDAATPSFSTVTDTAFASHNIYVSPKDGFLYANKFLGASTSVSWYQGRDSAAFRDTGSAGYHAALSLKTTNGSWEFGNYNASGYHDIPLLTYITDANYNSKNNSTTYQIKFPLKSGTIALTSDIKAGTVTSVSVTSSSLTVTGSPVTGSGTITIEHPTATTTTADIYKIGCDDKGHVVIGDKITSADLGLSNIYKYKGTKTWAELLALTSAEVGDVYSITNADPDGNTNADWACHIAVTAACTAENYADHWQSLGGKVDLSAYVTGSGTANYIPKFTNTGAIGNSVITQNSDNDVTVAGKLIVKSSGSTSGNSYNEGIRVLPASNGWSELFFSNTQATSSTHANGWILGKRGAAGATSGAAGDFTIECNGSGGTGLTLYANGNRPRWNDNELAYKSELGNASLPLRLQTYTTADTMPGIEADEATEQGWYYISRGDTNRPPFKNVVDIDTGTDYRIMSTAHSDSWVQQIATNFRSNDIFIRRKQSGTWQGWTSLVKMEEGLTNPTGTTNAIPRWEGTKNSTLKNSGITIDDNNNLTAPGNITLYKASGDSPKLIFLRGTTNDSQNDWAVFDSGGSLHFENRGSDNTWTRNITLLQDGGITLLRNGQIKKTNTAGTATYSYTLPDADGTLATQDWVENLGYVTGSYLPLAGGTMNANATITLPNSAKIIHHTNTTSNYVTDAIWYKGTSAVSSGYDAQIGWHNTGDTDGAIIILPYTTTLDPWSSKVGLYISKTRLKYNDTNVSLEGHGHTNMVTGSGLTADKIVVGNGESTIKTSSKGIVSSITSTDDNNLPTSKAVATYVTGLLEDLELGDSYQPLDTDLTAIAGLGDDTTTGLLRKNGKNSWGLDSNTYLKPGDNASANYLAFFKDGDEVSGSQNTHCDGVGNIKAASYGIYTDVANNKTATWQYNSSTDCVELVW